MHNPVSLRVQRLKLSQEQFIDNVRLARAFVDLSLHNTSIIGALNEQVVRNVACVRIKLVAENQADAQHAIDKRGSKDDCLDEVPVAGGAGLEFSGAGKAAHELLQPVLGHNLLRVGLRCIGG